MPNAKQVKAIMLRLSFQKYVPIAKVGRASPYYEAMKDVIAAGEKPPRRRDRRKPQLTAGKEQEDPT